MTSIAAPGDQTRLERLRSRTHVAGARGSQFAKAVINQPASWDQNMTIETWVGHQKGP